MEETEMAERENKEGTSTEEKTKVNADFCRCPFCACCFFTIGDLEKHLKTFGNSKEEHFENHRRTHARMEHGSANGPE
jgi:Zn-finger nucleic acid-binding protein